MRFAIAVALAGLMAPAAAAFASPIQHSTPAATQQAYWKWSDGSKETTRTFNEAEYSTAAKLPKLIVTADPSTPSMKVLLQFLQDGQWMNEAKVRTNADGVATLKLDPYCASHIWCDGTWSYRIKAGPVHQFVKITYVRQ